MANVTYNSAVMGKAIGEISALISGVRDTGKAMNEFVLGVKNNVHGTHASSIYGDLEQIAPCINKIGTDLGVLEQTLSKVQDDYNKLSY